MQSTENRGSDRSIFETEEKMKEPKVSVLIVHKNGEEILDNCLKSLEKTRYKNFEKVVLLNGTEDNSDSIARKYKCKVYRSRKNLGFAGGNNFLIKKTNSKYLVLANNDIEFEKDWLYELVRFAEKNNADVLQPKIKALKNMKMLEYAGACGGFIDKYGYPFCRGRIFNTIEQDFGQYDSPREIFWASGACMMLKRSILRKTGLLDEDFFMYAEELDLCWRINLAGGRLFCVPDSVVYHLGSYTINTEKLNQDKEFLIHRNTLAMFIKNNSASMLARLLWIRIAMEIASSFESFDKIRPVFSALIWIFRNRSVLKEKNMKVQKIRILNDKEIQKNMLKKSIVSLYFFSKKKTFDRIEGYF